MAADNVKFLRTLTFGDIPPDRVLDEAKGTSEHVLVIGIQPDGELYAASSAGDCRVVLWMCEQFKMNLLNGHYSGRRYT